MTNKRLVCLVAVFALLALNAKLIAENRAHKDTAALQVEAPTQDSEFEDEQQTQKDKTAPNWSLEDGTLTIESCDVFGEYNFAPPWEKDISSIKRVIIKGGEEITGFQEYRSLEEVTLPDTATQVDSYAFKGCFQLKSIDIPHGVRNIGSEAFMGCTALSKVTLPDTLTAIGADAFRGCRPLNEIELPEGLTGIGGRAFFHTGIKSVTLPRKMTNFNTHNYIIFNDFTEVLCYKNSDTAKNLEHSTLINTVFINDDGTLYDPPETGDDFDEKRAVQLTDYRYLNTVGSREGYNFMNVCGVSKKTTRGNDKNLLEYDTAILNPDGTELCEQGAYTAVCGETSYPIANGYFNLYQRTRIDDRVHTEGLYIVDKDGNVVKSDGEIYPFAGFLDSDRFVEGYVDGDGSVGAYTIESLSDDNRRVIVNGSPLQMSKDKKHFKFNTYSYGKGGVPVGSEESFRNEHGITEKDPDCEFYEYTYKPEGVYKDESGDICYTADENYVVKGKNINGTIYYALFKVLEDGESAKDYIPSEKPDTRYQSAIKALTDGGILYNNSNCRYKQRISKKDFYTVILQAYLGDREYNDYLKDNATLKERGAHRCAFCFSSDPYVRLAMYTGLADTTNDPQADSPAVNICDGLTVKKAQALINSFISTEKLNISVDIAALCGAKPDDELTREMAYAVAYEIYKA
ncbi:MAG: leucine-rich repeat protein [Firmicutes bacterium]|nr:leucine-rich repeat protein [Bacillota bacterium]